MAQGNPGDEGHHNASESNDGTHQFAFGQGRGCHGSNDYCHDKVGGVGESGQFVGQLVRQMLFEIGPIEAFCE